MFARLLSIVLLGLASHTSVFAAETCAPGEGFYGSCSVIPDPNFPVLQCPGGLRFDGTFCVDSGGNQVGDGNGNPLLPDGYSLSPYGIAPTDPTGVVPRTCGEHSQWNASWGICTRNYADPYWDLPQTCPGGRAWNSTNGCGPYDVNTQVYQDGWGDQTPAAGSGVTPPAGAASGAGYSQLTSELDVSSLLAALAVVALVACSILLSRNGFRTILRFVRGSAR